MIYLILSPAFKDKDDISKGYKLILKIGYTGENSRKSRFDCYLTENPYSKILYLIENGDLEDEKNLHIYFKEYKDKYGREWFEYNQAIIDFFETHKTKESLQEISNVIVGYTEKELHKISIRKSDRNIEMKASFITNEIISTFYTEEKTIEESKKLFKMILYDILFNFDEIEDYLIDTYGENFSNLVLSKLNKSLEESIDKEFNKHLDTIYSLGTYDKYRYLCSLDENLIKALLPHLPSSFSNYYTVLGPVRMKALRYNTTDMRKEYEGIIGNQNVDIANKVHNEFSVGERISKSEAKERLKKVYEENEYKKTPKAVDLGNYFIIKTIDIRNKETGKRDKGYEIIKVKEGD